MILVMSKTVKFKKQILEKSDWNEVGWKPIWGFLKNTSGQIKVNAWEGIIFYSQGRD